jgi:hypothetical protein
MLGGRYSDPERMPNGRHSDAERTFADVTDRGAQCDVRVHRKLLQSPPIGYLTDRLRAPERRHHALAIDPDAHQPAVVLATVKDKPSRRPQDAASLTADARDGWATCRQIRPVDPKLSPLHETGASLRFRYTNTKLLLCKSVGLTPWIRSELALSSAISVPPDAVLCA